MLIIVFKCQDRPSFKEKTFECVYRSFIAQTIISVNMILSIFNSARCPNFMHLLNHVQYYVW